MRADKQDERITKTREKILTSGAAVLFTDGWSEVTQLRLAKETGVARGTIYRHWATIDDLIVEIFESCDPSPYAAKRTGECRADLIAELTLLSQNLVSSKLGDVILNAARLADKNPKIMRIHKVLHEILRSSVMSILFEQGIAAQEGEVGLQLIAPILYHHLFVHKQSALDVTKIVDRFLTQFK